MFYIVREQISLEATLTFKVDDCRGIKDASSDGHSRYVAPTELLLKVIEFTVTHVLAKTSNNSTVLRLELESLPPIAYKEFGCRETSSWVLLREFIDVKVSHLLAIRSNLSTLDMQRDPSLPPETMMVDPDEQAPQLLRRLTIVGIRYHFPSLGSRRSRDEW